METETIEKIVSELLELDPTLKTHEAELRVLVRDMKTKTPSVVLDTNFVTSLRARLMVAHHTKARASKNFSWWMFRLVPLGAVALIVLVLVKPSPYVQEFEMGAPVTTRVSEDTDNDSARSADINTVMTPEVTSPLMSGGESADSSNADMYMKSAPMKAIPSVLPSPLTVSPQVQGVSVRIDSVILTEPGFVVVYTYLPDGRERLIGVSPYLNPGTTTNIPIYLSSRTVSGGTYVVTAHRDGGNRIFTYGDDKPFLDEYGNPITQTLEITEQAPKTPPTSSSSSR